MVLKNRKALTLVESLVSILILGALVVSILGAFIVSKISTTRARHRMAAMSIAKKYLESEISRGYYGGDYFTFLTGDSVTETLDGIDYSVTPYPYPPQPGEPAEGQVSYKLIGFQVTWQEPVYGHSAATTCSEKVVTYVANHSST